MEAHDYYLLALLAGLAIIIVLSVSEFTRNLRKPKQRWQYYVALLVFIAINVAAYLALTYAVVQESPVRLVFGDFQADLNAMGAWAPIAAALAYYFSGSGIFRLGKREVHLFGMLLDALQHLFVTRIPQELPAAVDSATDEYRRLRHLADIYRNRGEGAKWDLLGDQWNDFLEQDILLNDLLTELRGVEHKLRALSSRLPTDSPARRELVMLVADLKDKHDRLVGKLIRQLQRYLSRLGWTNLKDEVELETFLGQIGFVSAEHEPPSSMSRSLVTGFLFGLLFGPIFAHFEGKDVIAYMWLGSLTVMIFSGILAQGMRSSRFLTLSTVGALAGYAAHLFWNLVEWGLTGTLVNLDAEALSIRHLLTEPIIGLAYGAATAVILYLVRHYYWYFSMRPHSGLMLAAITGALSFPLIHMALNPALGTPDVALSNPLTVMALIGAIVVGASAVANNLCWADPDAAAGDHQRPSPLDTAPRPEEQAGQAT